MRRSSGTALASYRFDARSRRTGLTYTNGASAAYRYDTASRLLELDNQTNKGQHVPAWRRDDNNTATGGITMSSPRSRSWAFGPPEDHGNRPWLMHPTKVATARNSRRYWPRNAARTPLSRLLSQASWFAVFAQVLIHTGVGAVCAGFHPTYFQRRRQGVASRVGEALTGAHAGRARALRKHLPGRADLVPEGREESSAERK